MPDPTPAKRVYRTAMTPAQRTARARNAALQQHDPVNQAKRLVEHWPALTPEQQTTIRTVMRPVVRGSNG